MSRLVDYSVEYKGTEAERARCTAFLEIQTADPLLPFGASIQEHWDMDVSSPEGVASAIELIETMAGLVHNRSNYNIDEFTVSETVCQLSLLFPELSFEASHSELSEWSDRNLEMGDGPRTEWKIQGGQVIREKVHPGVKYEEEDEDDEDEEELT
jgi:hypothetical protein